MRRHPVFYALPLALTVLTVLTLAILELLGAECYENSIDGPGNCNDLGSAQHDFVAPIGFFLATMFLLLVLSREVGQRLERRKAARVGRPSRRS